MADPAPPTVAADPGQADGRSGLAAALSLYGQLLRARVSGQWQYRTSFFLMLTSQASVTALELLTVVLILQLVPDLGGWTASEVVLLYGLSALPFGLADTFVSPVELVSTYVQDGELDRLLLRPVSPLLQLSAIEFELRRVGKAIPAVLALAYGLITVDVAWTPSRVAVVLMAVASGTVIYSALWIAAGSFAFWATAAREATNTVTYGGQFANEYPLHLYRPWLRVLLGWAFPLAFVAYVPVQYLTDAANPLRLPPWLIVTTPAVAATALAISLGVWRLGLRRYQSTGS